jgi:hypothetical protein
LLKNLIAHLPVPADGQSFGREATKLAGRFQNFAGDRGVGATAKSDNKKIAAGLEAAAAEGKARTAPFKQLPPALEL